MSYKEGTFNGLLMDKRGNDITICVCIYIRLKERRCVLDVRLEQPSKRNQAQQNHHLVDGGGRRLVPSLRHHTYPLFFFFRDTPMV